jgi:di/tricarboxylate transporter
MWCLFSSAVLYSAAALIASAALRRHSRGRFYGATILVMGLIIPLSLGLLSSGAIAFVYKHSNFSMVPVHAMMWGVGQTVLHAAVGFTRILATL